MRASDPVAFEDDRVGMVDCVLSSRGSIARSTSDRFGSRCPDTRLSIDVRHETTLEFPKPDCFGARD
jgi:hypothetical protein